MPSPLLYPNPDSFLPCSFKLDCHPLPANRLSDLLAGKKASCCLSTLAKQPTNLQNSMYSPSSCLPFKLYEWNGIPGRQIAAERNPLLSSFYFLLISRTPLSHSSLRKSSDFFTVPCSLTRHLIISFLISTSIYHNSISQDYFTSASSSYRPLQLSLYHLS